MTPQSPGTFDVVNLHLVALTVTVVFVSPGVCILSVNSPASVLATVSVSPADTHSPCDTFHTHTCYMTETCGYLDTDTDKCEMLHL